MSDTHTGDDSGYITALIEALRTNTLLAQAAAALAALQAALQAEAARVRAQTIEECARVCDEWYWPSQKPLADTIARAIRALLDEAMK